MQAILILAHTNPEHVIRLAKLLKQRFEIYIHFDKKCVLTDAHKQLLETDGIHWFQEICVQWGGWSIGAAAELLMREAVKNPNITHVHVISGQDWPTANIEDIYSFYENNMHIYMECYSAEGIKKAGQPIILWQKYYYNFDKINRRTTFGKIYHRFIMAAQAIAGVDKFKKLQVDIPIYHGANWMDLPRDAVLYLLEYFDSHLNIQKLFKTGFCPDEFWVQTILHASPLQDRIVSEHHRFIVWEQRHNSYPAVLDESDFDSIISGDWHFCRKTIPEFSEKLIMKLGEKNGNTEK